MTRWIRALLCLSVATAVGCGVPAGTPAVGPAPVSAQTGDSAAARVAAAAMVPPGVGSLRQEEATVALRQGAVLLKIVPLNEAIIRLLAPDTYNRLRALRDVRMDEAKRTTSQPELYLVSFFSYQPDISFQPEDVQLMHQARLLRPLKILPQTSGWGQQQLNQQDTQAAIYIYEGPIDYDQQISVRYGQDESDEWQRTILPRLETERARIRGRVR